MGDNITEFEKKNGKMLDEARVVAQGPAHDPLVAPAQLTQEQVVLANDMEARKALENASTPQGVQESTQTANTPVNAGASTEELDAQSHGDNAEAKEQAPLMFNDEPQTQPSVNIQSDNAVNTSASSNTSNVGAPVYTGTDTEAMDAALHGTQQETTPDQPQNNPETSPAVQQEPEHISVTSAMDDEYHSGKNYGSANDAAARALQSAFANPGGNAGSPAGTTDAAPAEGTAPGGAGTTPPAAGDSDYLKAMTEADKQAETSFQDYIDAFVKQQQAREEEDRIREEAGRKSAAWAGATELATSIANLIGVGYAGSSHQQYKQYSADWMNQVDQERRAREQRIDSNRMNLANLNYQLANLKASNAKSQAQTAMNAAKTDSQIALNTARTERQYIMNEISWLEQQRKNAKTTADISKVDKQIEKLEKDMEYLDARISVARSQIGLNGARAGQANASANASNAKAEATRAGIPGKPGESTTPGAPKNANEDNRL